jgi:hypothetical protein
MVRRVEKLLAQYGPRKALVFGRFIPFARTLLNPTCGVVLLDRKLFSKLVSDRGYKPSKKMVCRLALALHLDAKDSKSFIKRAGFILTSGSVFDLTIRYCIENNIYDIYQVEALLEKEHLNFLIN